MSRQKTGAVLVGLGVALAALAGPAVRDHLQAAEAPYRLVENWPQWPAGMQFEYVAGVTVDAKGIVYAFVRDTDEKAGKGGTGSVAMFDRSGKYLGKWGPSGEAAFVTPHSLYVDRNGFFWSVDRDGHQIKKFSADGKVLLTLGKQRGFGNGEYSFNGPAGLQVLANGDFVVSDGYWNSRLVWFSREGKFLKSVGTYGFGPGHFGLPHAVAEDSRGRLLVADLCVASAHADAVQPGQIDEKARQPIPGCADRIQVLDKDGKHLSDWKTVTHPLSLIVVGERVYVGEVGGKDVVILDAASGKQIDIIKGASVSHSHQVGVDAQTGDVYVASVYPEHGGAKRGPGGPTLRRWTQQAK